MGVNVPTSPTGQEKAVSKPICIPRTTAMFVTCLASIIRDHFGFKVIEHEHWTFEHVADYEICNRPGNCIYHDAPWVEHNDLSCGLPCYQFRNKVYLGVGDVRVMGGLRYQLRAHIEHSHWDGAGDMYTARVWAASLPSEIIRGQFDLNQRGEPYKLDKECPARPPSKIDFWRSASAA